MEQLLLHMIGDYVTQNGWMANNKTKNTPMGYLACLVHCLLYSLPFLFIASFNAWLVIFLTHYLIDKFRLAKYFIQFREWHFKDNGYSAETPPYVSIWLLFITDNIFHVIINYLSIKYL